MLKLAADEDFNNDILRGMLRELPSLDIVRVQDTDWMGAEDPDTLEWASSENRVMLSHDVNTMTDFAKQRVNAGLKMPVLVIAPRSLGMGRAVEELGLFAGASFEGEYEGQIVFLPL
jgi:hypothetical protein